MTFDQPVFFVPNRVWRCYTGGKLLDRFVGTGAGADGHKPEDWLASTVRAMNDKHSQGPHEGLARVQNPDGKAGQMLTELLHRHGEELLGPRHVVRFGPNMALLCKYLDSAVRLPIQCHPDAAIAKRLYNSNFGKAECWHILDTRKIGGQEPYLLMGFKPNVTAKAFAEAVAKQTVLLMEEMLHKLHVRAGETYMVPARLPHAIGPGVFMLEVQEPSDWVIQPERFCADTRLTNADMWGPLTVEQGLGVFDYTGRSKPQLMEDVLMKETALHEEPGGTVAEVIGPRRTEAFGVWTARIRGTMRVSLPRAFGVIVATGGAGTMSWQGGSRPVRRGQHFLQPFGVKWIEYSSDEGLSLVLCLPPKS